jgi:hypothetical protein
MAVVLVAELSCANAAPPFRPVADPGVVPEPLDPLPPALGAAVELLGELAVALELLAFVELLLSGESALADPVPPNPGAFPGAALPPTWAELAPTIPVKIPAKIKFRITFLFINNWNSFQDER